MNRDVPTDDSAEAALSSECPLEDIIDSAIDAIITVDASQHIRIFNSSAEKIFACSRAEAIGQPLEKFIPSDYRQTFREHVHHQCKERHSPGIVEDLYGLRTTGEEFPMEASISQLEAGGEKLCTLILRDVSSRKESELALQHAHEELRQLKTQLEEENLYLQEELQHDHAFGEIIGHSDAIKYVLAKISQVAPTDSTVLIQGETGTGKELVARAIHSASAQRDRPLIKVNCAALSATLIESELFGHEKGAFTGAGARKLGRFELADGGTIFLDEVGELPLDLQVKLLRVVQEGEFERVGGSHTIKVHVRLITATNRDLKMEVDQGRFRQDLWYRLNVFPITVPPLRQRREDIPLMVEYFVSRSAKRVGKSITSISWRAMQSLQQHSWPGNVRELANVIEREVIGARGTVLDFVERFDVVKDDSTPPMTLQEMEHDYIVRILESTGWRVEGQYGAAKILGLNASTLRARMQKLGIHRHGPRSAKPQDFTSPLSNTDSAKY